MIYSNLEFIRIIFAVEMRKNLLIEKKLWVQFQFNESSTTTKKLWKYNESESEFSDVWNELFNKNVKDWLRKEKDLKNYIRNDFHTWYILSFTTSKHLWITNIRRVRLLWNGYVCWWCSISYGPSSPGILIFMKFITCEWILLMMNSNVNVVNSPYFIL